MKRLIFTALVAAAVSLAAPSGYAQGARELPLTNTAIVKLVRAGFKEKTVIAIIRNRANRFNLDPDRLIELKRNGVTENIILVMLSQSEGFVLSEDDWGNDPFFRGRTPGERPQSDSGIFGSSGGSSSQTDGRGLSGGNQDQTTTTGSATVRILRPPSEAGGTQLKLEKTPTLDNEAVIRLVEAGFSEGTIIKRIEDSPAEFDLSEAKLAELRRRRVTDAIIVAMVAAMGQESTGRTTPAKSKGN